MIRKQTVWKLPMNFVSWIPDVHRCICLLQWHAGRSFMKCNDFHDCLRNLLLCFSWIVKTWHFRAYTQRWYIIIFRIFDSLIHFIESADDFRHLVTMFNCKYSLDAYESIFAKYSKLGKVIFRMGGNVGLSLESKLNLVCNQVQFRF